MVFGPPDEESGLCRNSQIHELKIYRFKRAGALDKLSPGGARCPSVQDFGTAGEQGQPVEIRDQGLEWQKPGWWGPRHPPRERNPDKKGFQGLIGMAHPRAR